ncbi:MurR/RpiR family transcriptional regulator [Clostridium sp. SYSU_GA19001]|uniref:MurR/RpiR family transcriptional regulator n=1 Tax=Clostridium caldaquaticum TaxID=2940653 RepID=UPI0020774007|nr:MurR/RpiR family transcriptional regulator [Clostridium caldaquaticum]MCM8709919.1 MurR/RpiR family transcriptional regulator [Clostridium caldaquaticum]
MTGLENIIAFYNNTPEDNMFHSVLRNILTNLDKVENYNIYDLANMCFTSPATISRLVKKLGYKNYTYFQKDLSDCVKKYEHLNRYIKMEEIEEKEDLQEAFLNTLENLIVNFRKQIDKAQLRRLAEEIHRSKRVSIYTYGVNFAEFYLQSDLFMSGIICDVYNDDKSQFENAQTLDKQCIVILVIPKCIESSAVDKTITAIKERGAKLCVITDTKHFSILKKADLSFTFEGELHLIDMYILQMFLSLLSIQYRSMYLD